MMVLLMDLDLVLSFSYVQMAIYNHSVLLIVLLHSEVRSCYKDYVQLRIWNPHCSLWTPQILSQSAND